MAENSDYPSVGLDVDLTKVVGSEAALASLKQYFLDIGDAAQNASTKVTGALADQAGVARTTATAIAQSADAEAVAVEASAVKQTASIAKVSSARAASVRAAQAATAAAAVLGNNPIADNAAASVAPALSTAAQAKADKAAADQAAATAQYLMNVRIKSFQMEQAASAAADKAEAASAKAAAKEISDAQIAATKAASDAARTAAIEARTLAIQQATDQRQAAIEAKAASAAQLAAQAEMDAELVAEQALADKLAASLRAAQKPLSEAEILARGVTPLGTPAEAPAATSSSAQMAEQIAAVEAADTAAAKAANSAAAAQTEFTAVDAVAAPVVQRLTVAQEALNVAYLSTGKVTKDAVVSVGGYQAAVQGLNKLQIEGGGAAILAAQGLKEADFAAAGAGVAFNISSASARELVVILRELLRGDFSRLAGSASILAGQFGLLKLLMNPVVLLVIGLTAAVAASTAAVLTYADSLRKLSEESSGVGAAVGLTSSQIQDAAKAAAQAQNISAGAALKQAQVYATTGKISGDVLTGLTSITQEYAEATGQKAAPAASELAKAFADPVKGAADLNDKMNFLNATQLQNIENMAKQGDLAGAQKVLFDALQGSLGATAEKTGALTNFFISLKTAILNIPHSVGITLFYTFGGKKPLQDQIKDAQTALSVDQDTLASDPSYASQVAADQARIDSLTKQLATDPQTLRQTQAAADKASTAGFAAAQSVLPDSGTKQNLVNQKALVDAALASQAGDTGSAIDMEKQAQEGLNIAIKSYLDPASKAHAIAVAQEAAAKAVTPAQKADAASKLAIAEASGEVLTASQLQQKAQDAANLATDKSTKVGKDAIDSLHKQQEAVAGLETELKNISADPLAAVSAQIVAAGKEAAAQHPGSLSGAFQSAAEDKARLDFMVKESQASANAQRDSQNQINLQDALYDAQMKSNNLMTAFWASGTHDAIQYAAALEAAKQPLVEAQVTASNLAIAQAKGSNSLTGIADAQIAGLNGAVTTTSAADAMKVQTDAIAQAATAEKAIRDKAAIDAKTDYDKIAQAALQSASDQQLANEQATAADKTASDAQVASNQVLTDFWNSADKTSAGYLVALQKSRDLITQNAIAQAQLNIEQKYGVTSLNDISQKLQDSLKLDKATADAVQAAEIKNVGSVGVKISGSAADAAALSKPEDLAKAAAVPLDALSKDLDHVTAQANLLGTALSDAFGAPGKAIADLISSLNTYSKAALDAQTKLAAAAAADPTLKSAEYQKVAAETAQDTANAQVAAYGDMITAAKGFFKEGTQGYKALQFAEEAYRLFQFAMSAKAIIVQTVETAAKLGLFGAQTAAAAQAGAAEMFASLGPAGFAAVAAMLAVLAGLGAALSGGSSGPGNYQTSAQIQAKQGTGTILGDPAKQSDSIVNAVTNVGKDVNANLEYSNKMVIALQAIQDSIGLVAKSLGQQLGLSTGVFDTSKLGLGTTSSSPSAIAALLTGGLSLLFGSKKTTTLEDQGLNFGTGQTVGQIDSSGITAQAYQDALVETKKSILGFTYSDKTKLVETDNPLDTGVTSQITQLIGSLKTGVATAAATLGVTGADAILNAMVVSIGKVSLTGLTGDQIQEQLDAVFGAVADNMATTVLPIVTQFQQVGEGAFDTLTRLARDYQVVDVTLASLGMTFKTVGVDSIAARENLITLSGGLDNFTSQAEYFSTNFLTQAQQLAPIQASVAAQFAALGVSGITTRTQFANLVLGLDTSTDAGAKMYAALMALAPAFAAITTAATDVTDAISKISDTAKSLLTGSLSPYNPQQVLGIDQSQYASTLASAQTGDATALGNLPDAAQAYLTQAQQFYGSSSAYAAIFQQVEDSLNALTGAAGDPTVVAIQASAADVVAATNAQTTAIVAAVSNLTDVVAGGTEAVVSTTSDGLQAVSTSTTKATTTAAALNGGLAAAA